MIEIPAPLPFSYASRPRSVQSARITVLPLEGGGLEQRIEHAPLPGVTREMLLWWMHRLGSRVVWEGREVKAYRLWHPRDHIDWSCEGPVRPGCRFHIQEAFGAERRFLVDQAFDVPKLDLSGFRLETGMFGVARLSIDEDWSDSPEGARWINTMRLVPIRPLYGPLVRLGRALKRRMFTAWLTHNVEEVGFVPEFLPALVEGRAPAATAASDDALSRQSTTPATPR